MDDGDVTPLATPRDLLARTWWPLIGHQVDSGAVQIGGFHRFAIGGGVIAVLSFVGAL
jgi:hypothetical protein